MTAVFRVQHKADGRGPFRPGFTATWSDDAGHILRSTRPSWIDEFGSDAVQHGGRPSEHFGSAVAKHADLANWFSSGERGRLADLGYVCVRVPDARVIAASPNQVLFARAKPLTVGVQRVRWP